MSLNGCSINDEGSARRVAEEFGRSLYTVDSKKVDDYNSAIRSGDIETLSKMLQVLDKTIQPLMTEKGYKTLVANRDDIINVQSCAKNNITMQVAEFTLNKDFYDSKQNTAQYYYEAKLKLTSSNGKNEDTDAAKVYIALAKENGQWKVSAYKMTLIPKVLLKR